MLLLPLAFAAGVATLPSESALAQCLRGADEIPLNMAACYQADRDRWQRVVDAELARRAAGRTPLQARIAAQRQAQWARGRDLKCKKAGEIDEGGSQQGADVAACYARETKARAIRLSER